MIAANSPLIEPPITIARRLLVIGNSCGFSSFPRPERFSILCLQSLEERHGPEHDG
jgi:hypothetical protein